jgi:pimeloyl-ACP methyl ester carboxylesterase
MNPGVKLLAEIGVAATAALGALAWLRSRGQPRFPYMAHDLPDADYAAMAARPGWRAHSLRISSRITLRGLLRDPDTPGGPWILYFGGNSAAVLREGQQILDALCAGQGWGAALWAYRGFDCSGGKPSPAALLDDGLVSYRALLAECGGRPNAVHVIGFSLGTSIASAVAARARPGPPASLLLLAPLTRIHVGGRMRPWLHAYETIRWLAGIASPVLVIHGVEDTALSVAGARTVAAALGSRAQLLELPGIGHVDLPRSAAAQQAIRTFILQHARRARLECGTAG